MQTKQEALAGVAAFATAVRAIIMSTSDGIKIAGLADKARDAFTFLHHKADDPDEYILTALQTECVERNRGETPTELAKSILLKSANFKYIRAKLDGLESRFETAVEMAPTDELAVQTYEVAKDMAKTELVKLGIPEQVLSSL